MLLNFHTHHPRKGEHYVHSIGLHPWHLDADTYEYAFAQLKSNVMKGHYAMIGECGLDKACTTPFNLQRKAFADQLHLAETMEKPVVVHCVRAYNELLEVRRQSFWSQPWIVHGYTGSLQMAKHLQKEGICFSFGRYIERPKVQDVIRYLSTELLNEHVLLPLFLETDDNPDLAIEQVYDHCAKIINVPRKLVEDAIELYYGNLMAGAYNR